MKRSAIVRRTPLRSRSTLKRSTKRMRPRRDTTYAARRYRCVQLVTWRQCGLCACGCERAMTDPHEEPPRSKGGDPCNPLDVIGLSRFCHDLRHFGSRDKRLRISYLDGTADRRVEFAIGSARWVTRSNETTGPVIIDGEHYEQPMTAAGITRVQYLQEQGLNAD